MRIRLVATMEKVDKKRAHEITDKLPELSGEDYHVELIVPEQIDLVPISGTQQKSLRESSNVDTEIGSEEEGPEEPHEYNVAEAEITCALPRKGLIMLLFTAIRSTAHNTPDIHSNHGLVACCVLEPTRSSVFETCC